MKFKELLENVLVQRNTTEFLYESNDKSIKVENPKHLERILRQAHANKQHVTVEKKYSNTPSQNRLLFTSHPISGSDTRMTINSPNSAGKSMMLHHTGQQLTDFAMHTHNLDKEHHYGNVFATVKDYHQF